MPALVAMMIMASIGTFSRASLKNLRVDPMSSSLVMIATVVVVVGTHNLALGVGVGVLLSALSFARKIAQVFRVRSELDAAAGCRTDIVSGQIFFASAPAFASAFDFKEAIDRVRIDVSHAHFWDLTGVGALDKVVLKFRREGTEVEVLGFNEAGATIVDRLAVHDKPGALERMLGHCSPPWPPLGSILVCTNGSIYAPCVYQHAAWAAQPLVAQVQVLHVIEHPREQSPTRDLSGAIGINATAELTSELAKVEEARGRVARLRGKAILEEAQRQLGEAGVSEVSTFQRHGAFVETLEELEPNAELVVVGTRGERADFTKGHLGASFEDLIRISIRPVLVVARAFKPFRRFLIAFEDSPSARKAVAYAVSSPLLRGLECHLMMVGRADPAHAAALNRAREQPTQAGYGVTAQIKPGSAGTVIAEEVQRSGIDLLVSANDATLLETGARGRASESTRRLNDPVSGCVRGQRHGRTGSFLRRRAVRAAHARTPWESPPSTGPTRRPRTPSVVRCDSWSPRFPTARVPEPG